MSFRGTYALFAVLAALLAGTSAALMYRGKPLAADYLLPSLKRAEVQAKDITRLSIERTGEQPAKLAFERQPLENRWRVTEPYGGRADGALLERLVGELIDARTAPRPDQTRNLATYDLDPAPVKVTLTAGETAGRLERNWTISLGKITVDGSVYAVSSDAPGVPSAVPAGSLRELFRPGTVTSKDSVAKQIRGVADFRAKELLAPGVTAPADAFRHVRVTVGPHELALKKEDTGWQFEKPAGMGAADVEGDPAAFSADQPFSGVTRMFEALTGLRVAGNEDYVEDKKSDADFGFDDAYAERLTAEVRFVPPARGDVPTEVTDKLTVGKPADDKGEKRFARMDGDPTVFKIASAGLKPVRLTVEPRPGRQAGESLRDHTLVRFTPASVDAVDIKPAGQTPIEMRKTGEPASWYVFGGTEPGRPANTTAVNALTGALANKRVVEEFPARAADEPQDKFEQRLGLDKPRFELVVWEGGVVKPADKPAEGADKDKPPAPAPAPGTAPAKPDVSGTPKFRLVAGKEDKGIVYVRRIVGDSQTDLAVKADALAPVKLGRLDYVDPQLPSFEADKALKFKLTRGGKTFEVERDAADKDKPLGVSRWKLTAPAELAGVAADAKKVESSLRLLATLKANSLVAETVNEQELERFGLKSPAVEALVTLPGDKDNTRAFLFGKDAGTADSYAKQGERNLIFAAARSSRQTLENVALRDPQPLRKLDPAKVTAVKFVGWKNITPVIQTQEYEKKDGTWSLKGHAEPIDGPKVETFLRELAGVSAQEFVVNRAQAKPEHKLTPETGALVVTVTQEGEPQPLTLSIGEQVPDKPGTVFAESNQFPGDVFTLAKLELLAVKAAASYFVKR